MDDRIGKKGVAAEGTPGREYSVHFNSHFNATSAGRSAKKSCSNISEKLCQGLRAFLDTLLRIPVITGLAALVLVGSTERARATCADLYNVGVPQLEQSDVSSFDYTEVASGYQPTRRNVVYKGEGLNTGDNIERIRYHYLDRKRYGYLDKGQYNLLGGMSYIIENLHYGRWNDFSYNWQLNSRIMPRVLYGPILPVIGLYPFNELHRDSIKGLVGTDSYNGPLSISNAGNYIDKWQYYLLDSAQYYYIDTWQYKLLGGESDILGHPCYPLWYHYGYAIPEPSISGHPSDPLWYHDGYAIPEPSTIALLGLGTVGTLSIGKQRWGWKRPSKR